MPRIRTLKPDMHLDELIGSCTRDARLLFVLLITQADDYGRQRAAPAVLSALFPYDEDATPQQVAGWLDELAATGRVRLYTVEGQQYAEIVNWAKHQRIDNAGKSAIPPPAATRGESPQPAAVVRGSPLESEVDQDRELSSLPTDTHQSCPQDPIERDVWELVADHRYATRRDTDPVRNLAAWRRKVIRNERDQWASKLAALRERYPADTPTGLASRLLGTRRPEPVTLGCEHCDDGWIIGPQGATPCPACSGITA